MEFWVLALSREDYELASAMLAQPQWTAEALRAAVESHGRLSDPAQTEGGEPSHQVELADGPEVLGKVRYHLPLDGKWSDVTATFHLCARDGLVALELQDLG